VTEIARIIDQLQRAYDGNPWYGPSLTSVLQDVTPEKAAAQPGAGVHSIWELVAHVAAWQEIAVRRLSGEIVKDVPESVNFPPVKQKDAAGWQKTLAGLASAHTRLVDLIRKLDESKFDQMVWEFDNLPGEKYSVYFLVHGVIQHNTYHTGQIALLKKL